MTRVRAAVLAAAASLLLPGLRAQDSAPSLARIVERANNPNPYLAAQAKPLLEKAGASALAEIEAFVAARSVHALSAPVVTWLGELDDARARSLLVAALANREFPWRPYAARALAAHPRAGTMAVFEESCGDRLGPVREAALNGLVTLARTDASLSDRVTARLTTALDDVAFEVRCAAASGLLALGDRRGIPVLVESLRISRRFFDLDFGALARRRAWDGLKPALREGLPFDPDGPEKKRTDLLPGIEARARVLLGDLPWTIPVRARATDETGRAILGLEVRSCRQGDAFIRLTDTGELVMGDCNLERKPVDAAQRNALLGKAEDARKLANGSHHGRGGCDFEKWYLPDERGLIRITVGPDGRPPELRPLSLALADAIERAFGSAAGEAFRARVAGFAAPDEEGE